MTSPVRRSKVYAGPALLLVDILGTKSVWTKDGCDGAALLFERFNKLIREELRVAPVGRVRGGVESDCAALICPSVADAVTLGMGLYRRAFFHPRSASTQRIWLRGVIVPAVASEAGELRKQAPLSAWEHDVTVDRYSDDLLDAISMEKAGFKGMRLLLDADMVGSRVRRLHTVDLGAESKALVPFRRLTQVGYGARLDNHLDVLWMATPDHEVWSRRRARMAARLRYSAANQEEVLQAAATQVVFDECRDAMASLRDD